MMSWRVLKACKQALVAFPYATYTSYVVNAPTLIYLLRQFAAKVEWFCTCLLFSFMWCVSVSQPCVGFCVIFVVFVFKTFGVESRVLRFCAFFCVFVVILFCSVAVVIIVYLLWLFCLWIDNIFLICLSFVAAVSRAIHHFLLHVLYDMLNHCVYP